MSSATARAMSSDRSSASRCVLGRCADPGPSSGSAAHRRSASAPRCGASARLKRADSMMRLCSFSMGARRVRSSAPSQAIDRASATTTTSRGSPGATGSLSIQAVRTSCRPCSMVRSAAMSSSYRCCSSPNRRLRAFTSGSWARTPYCCVLPPPMRSTRPDASSRSSAFRAPAWVKPASLAASGTPRGASTSWMSARRRRTCASEPRTPSKG